MHSGMLKVAEVSSRFAPIEDFVEIVKATGFRLDKEVSSCLAFCSGWALSQYPKLTDMPLATG